MPGTSSRAWSLVSRLAAMLLVLLAATSAVLFGYLAPAATSSFLAHGEQLVATSATTMTGLAASSRAEQEDVLVNLIRHTTDARARMLADLPLSLYAGDVDRLRDVIRDRDAERGRRLQQNVAVLAGEMERRSRRAIEQHIGVVRDDQLRLARVFAGDLRRGLLWVTGGVFFTLLSLLAFGLFRDVLAPLNRLRRATRALTRGELHTDVDVSGPGEVGDLAHDFGQMVQQLRQSRLEIERKNADLRSLNDKLEGEVRRQTGHLERTIEDLRQTQRKLLHSEKMAAIGTLAGGIAHEFNNLIGGIRGCTEEMLEGETDPDRREPLEVIRRAAQRATDVTRDLLRFARPRLQRSEPIDLAVVLAEAVRLIEPQARRANVAVEQDLTADLTIRGDADALHQVFMNLLRNAVQAMPSGGQLSLRGTRTTDQVMLEFADTGIGIPADRLAAVFDPFHTSKEDADDADRRGTGLGLSVSYGIVEAHGGTLTVQSEPDRGSVFTVTLPLGLRTENDHAR